MYLTEPVAEVISDSPSPSPALISDSPEVIAADDADGPEIITETQSSDSDIVEVVKKSDPQKRRVGSVEDDVVVVEGGSGPWEATGVESEVQERQGQTGGQSEGEGESAGVLGIVQGWATARPWSSSRLPMLVHADRSTN